MGITVNAKYLKYAFAAVCAILGVAIGWHFRTPGHEIDFIALGIIGGAAVAWGINAKFGRGSS